MNIFRRTLILMLTVTATAVFAQQPNPTQLAQQYSDEATNNEMMLARYSWKMRTEFTFERAGETQQIVKLYEVRIDLDGKSQKTELTAPSVQPEAQRGRKHGIRARVEKKKESKKQEKVAEFKEWASALSELSQSYATPSAGTMLDFFSKASYAPLGNGLVEVKGRDFLQPGDSVTFVLDGATKTPRSFAFRTTLGRDAVQGKVEYGQVPGGPRYAKRTTVNVPARQITAKVENYEYREV